jgi:predicted ATPase
LVGSYRPVDLALHAPFLKVAKQALVANRRASDVPLQALTSFDVETYLSRRLAGEPLAPGLGRDLHARTDGNPLFMTAIIDYLLERGILVEAGSRWRLWADRRHRSRRSPAACAPPARAARSGRAPRPRCGQRRRH